MPDIRPEEISLCTADGAGWSVGLGCDPCKALFPVQIEALRGHRLYRRPFVWIAQGKVVFRCKRCGSPATGVYVSRPGDGAVFSVDLLDARGKAALRNR